MVVQETEFLDASTLHAWLSSNDLQKAMRDNRNANIRLISLKPEEWILPVFIFEMAKPDALAFEDGKQAVGFSDLVIGVRTHGGEFQSDLSCSGHGILVDSANLTRPLLASILQTGLEQTHIHIKNVNLSVGRGGYVRDVVSGTRKGAGLQMERRTHAVWGLVEFNNRAVCRA